MQFKLGISMAASWAWGVSLGVSFSILHEKGIIPFLIWGLFNILALTVYGLFVRKYPEYLRLKDNEIVKLAMIGIQIFSIWINVKIMAMFVGDIPASIIATIFFILTYKYGFRFSLNSDQWQYLVMVLGLILVISFGEYENPFIAGNSINWAIWGGTGLLAGPFLDGQHFQRASKARSIKPFIIASIAFGLYLTLVYFAAYYNNGIAGILMVLIVIAVATSTLDSCIASMQYLTNNRTTVIISILALIIWPVFKTKTAVEIWSIYAIGRIYIVVPMILWVTWRAKYGQRY
jgi:hypothetical protein